MGVISKAKLEIHTRPSKRLNVVQISWHCPLFGTCYLSKCGPRPCMPLHHILLKQAIIIGMLYLTSEVVNDYVSLWINYSKQASSLCRIITKVIQQQATSTLIHKTLKVKMSSESC